MSKLTDDDKLYIRYRGVVKNGSKWTFLYAVADTQEGLEDEDVSIYQFPTKLKNTWAGTTFTINGKMKPEGDGFTYHKETARFVKDLPREKKTEEVARVQAEEAWMRKDKTSKEFDWRDQLWPVREAYREARGGAKTLLLAQVVAYITGSGR